MTDKTMTLDGVRKWHLDCASVYARSGESALADQHQRLADAITRHLSQSAERGEAVAWLVESETAGSICVELSEMAANKVVAEVIHEYRDAYGKITSRPLVFGDTAPPPAAGVPDERHIPPPGADVNHELESAYVDGWNACRAAMLSANPSPAIDVAAVREVQLALEDKRLHFLADKLARAIGMDV